MAYTITCGHEGSVCDGAEFCNTCQVQIFSGYKDADERYCNDHKPATWDAEVAAMAEEFDGQDEMYWTQWEIEDIFCECPTDCPCRPAPEALQALYDADRKEPVLSNEEYVDAGGFACPGCGDTRFLKVERFIVAQATLRCTECKATWTEEYTLARYSNFNPDLTR